MVNRFVTVDEDLQLPPEVQAALRAQLDADFTALSDSAAASAATATTAANTSTTKASEAATSAAAAQSAADEAVSIVTGDLDDSTSTLVLDTGSSTRASLDAVFTKPTMTSGTYAARPLASSVLPNSVYDATDVPESYRSTGSTWVVRPSGGTELGYAETLTPFATTSTGWVDIPALTTTFKVGERPIKVRFGGQVGSSVAGAWGYVQLVLDSTVIGQVGGYAGLNAGNWVRRELIIRKSGLTPGSTHTLKAQLVCYTGGGTTTLIGDPTNPAAIAVETT